MRHRDDEPAAVDPDRDRFVRRREADGDQVGDRGIGAARLEVGEGYADLLGDGLDERLLLDEALLAEDRAERPAGLALAFQRLGELLARDQALFDEHLSERLGPCGQMGLPFIRGVLSSFSTVPRVGLDRTGQTMTRMISSIEVTPASTLSTPSERRVRMPCSGATRPISSAERRSAISRSISSDRSITSWAAIRPR